MSVTINDKGARAKVEGTRIKRALATCVENIRADCEPLVLKETGNLRLSVDTSRGEEGLISWRAPYARYAYYMKSPHVTTPGTRPRWVEYAKSKNMDKWAGVIKEVLDG